MRSRRLAELMSPLSGRISVVERGRERRLIAFGEIQSIYFPDGDWSPAGGEYWGRAILPAAALPPRASALLVGLGGGTQLHLLRRHTAIGHITVLERDPAIIEVARQWFGLGEVGDVEVCATDVEIGTAALAEAGRRFEFIMDDVSYASDPVEATHVARGLAALLAPTGVLVLNQHRRAPAQQVAEGISDLLPRIRIEHVRHGVENVLVIATP